MKKQAAPALALPLTSRKIIAFSGTARIPGEKFNEFTAGYNGSLGSCD